MSNPSNDTPRRIGIEASQRRRPIITRLCALNKPVEHLTFLLVLTWKYSVSDASYLPPASMYGTIRQYFNVADVEEIVECFSRGMPSGQEVEFASDIDADWSEHCRFMELVE